MVHSSRKVSNLQSNQPPLATDSDDNISNSTHDYSVIKAGRSPQLSRQRDNVVQTQKLSHVALSMMQYKYVSTVISDNVHKGKRREQEKFND